MIFRWDDIIFEQT